MADRIQDLLDQIERTRERMRNSAFFERVAYAFQIIEAETELGHLQDTPAERPSTSPNPIGKRAIYGEPAL